MVRVKIYSSTASKNFRTACLIVVMICGCVDRVSAQADAANNTTNVNESYPEMPSIPPIGVKISKYPEVPVASLGPTIDPAPGYRVQDLGRGLYMVTDNAYQSMFMVYD